jgi:flagellar biosynthesis protein FliR
MLYILPLAISSARHIFHTPLASQACFFNVQPASGILKEVAVGVLWSNFVGICLFHAGNMINCYDMSMTMFDRTRFLSHNNLPVIGMWVYTMATTLLVTADG